MSIISIDEPPGAAKGATTSMSFWRRLARALDQYFIDRTKRAMPEATLRRSKQEIARCRRLMHEGLFAPVAANVPGTGGRRTAQTRSR